MAPLANVALHDDQGSYFVVIRKYGKIYKNLRNWTRTVLLSLEGRYERSGLTGDST